MGILASSVDTVCPDTNGGWSLRKKDKWQEENVNENAIEEGSSIFLATNL